MLYGCYAENYKKRKEAETMNEKYEQDDRDTVTLTLEDDSEVECAVVTIFEAAGREYIALLPLDGIESEEGEVYLYRFKENGDGEPDLQNIESDDEYEAASDAFDEWLDAQEYDELVDADDLDDLDE